MIFNKKIVDYIFLVFCLVSNADAKQSIIWAEYELFPVYITTGENKGKGSDQEMENDIRNHLKEYDHIVQVENLNRIKYLQKNLPNVCSTLLITPDRTKYLDFSKIYAITLPHGLVINRANFDKFKDFIDENNELDLVKAIKSNTIKILYTQNRRYGKFLDDIILKNKNSSSLFGQLKNDDTHLKYLTHNRVDGYISYPTEYKYNIDHNNIKESDTMFLRIKNNKYLFAAIGCSKSELSKKLIEKINTYIDQNRNNLIRYYYKWVDKETASYIENNIDKIYEGAESVK